MNKELTEQEDDIEKTIYVVLNTKGGKEGNLTWVVKSFETQLEAELYCKDQPHLQWVDSTISYKTAQSKQKESSERVYTEQEMKNCFESAREFNSRDGVVNIDIVIQYKGADNSDLEPVYPTFQEFINSLNKT